MYICKRNTCIRKMDTMINTQKDSNIMVGEKNIMRHLPH